MRQKRRKTPFACKYENIEKDNPKSRGERDLFKKGENGMTASWKNPLHQRLGKLGLYRRIS